MVICLILRLVLGLNIVMFLLVLVVFLFIWIICLLFKIGNECVIVVKLLIIYKVFSFNCECNVFCENV